ncbi:MAG: hypothetical protein OHK0023_11090 [Anaerolineae bacterium]
MGLSQPEYLTTLNEAIALIKRGDLAEARLLLAPLAEAYPHIEAIWLWQAAAAEDDEKRLDYLRRANEINPRNNTTRQAIFALSGETPPTPPLIAPETVKQIISTAQIGAILLLAGLVTFVFVFLVGTILRPILTPPSPTPTPTYTVTPSPTVPSPTPIISDTLPPTWTPAPSDTARPAPTQPPRPTVRPTNTRQPTRTPQPTNTPLPTRTPTLEPTVI